MPKLKAAGMSMKSARISDTRLYIQAVSDKLMGRIQHGTQQRDKDVLHAGVLISNSEVGAGSLSIEPMVYRLVCTNGLISGKALRRNHVGRGRGGDGDDIAEYFSDATRALDDVAFWAKVSDVIDAAFDEARFRALVDKLQGATRTELPLDPNHIVDVTAHRLDLSKDERDSVLRHCSPAAT
jgi:hypothetical protein